MSVYHGKFYRKAEHREGKAVPFSLIVLSFFAIELFSFFFLSLTEEFHSSQLWPLAFGGLWAVILSGIVRMLPGKAARVECGQPPMSLGKKGKAIIVLKKHSGHLEHFPVVHSLEQRLLPCVFGQNMVSMIETNLAAGIDTVLSFPEF